MQKRIFINEQIRARQVRVIGENGEQIGIMSLEEALRIARERNLDLVQITGKVEPPICKIADYGKYLYQQMKKEKMSRAKGSELKGIRLSFAISPHDIETRVNQAVKFLEKGDKIRIEMRLRGRQKAPNLTDFAKSKVEDFIEKLRSRVSVKTEKELKVGPNGLTMIISRDHQP